jgi:hypothetical protein
MAKFRRSHNPKANKGFSNSLLWILLLTILLVGGVGMYLRNQKAISSTGTSANDFRSWLPFFPRGEVFTDPHFSLNYDEKTETTVWFSFLSSSWNPALDKHSSIEITNDILLSPRPKRDSEYNSLLMGAIALPKLALQELATDTYLQFKLSDVMVKNYQKQVSLLLERFGGKSPEERIISGPLLDGNGQISSMFFVVIIVPDLKNAEPCRFFVLDLNQLNPAEGISQISGAEIVDRGGPDFKACRP